MLGTIHQLAFRSLCLILLALCCSAAQTAVAAEPEISLERALRELESRGLRLFYTSRLVRPSMRSPPPAQDAEPLQVLADILLPHGLVYQAGPQGRLFIVRAAGTTSSIRGLVVQRGSGQVLAGVRVLVAGTSAQTFTDIEGTFELGAVPVGRQVVEAHEPGYVIAKLPLEVPFGASADIVIELDVGILALDEIVVTPSRVSLLRDEPVAGLGLAKEDIFALPHLGDDLFRALSLLPGISGEEVSARFHVRGGRSDEVLILLDQVELYEPYHLKDYSSSVSIISPRTLGGVDLVTGGFPAQYGDRMGGVLEMTTTHPVGTRNHLGLGILSAEAARAGSFADERGAWSASARRGFLDLTLDFLGQNEKPRYWDAFGKLDYQLDDHRSLGLSALYSSDRLDFDNVDPDNTEKYLTGYKSSYLWASFRSSLGRRAFVDGTLSSGRVKQHRQGSEADLKVDDQGFSLTDQRHFGAVSLKQNWHFQLRDGHYLRGGFEARHLVATYDYFNSRQLDDPLAAIRAEPRTGTRSFVQRFEGEQYSVYLSDRWRPLEGLTAELGLRYDEYTLTSDRDLSPRLNLVRTFGASSSLRVAWGYFSQSQRPYELQVADGVTSLGGSERTKQWVIGFERAFSPAASGDYLLRIEAYERRVRRPRSRYENIFEPISIFPEIEADRVLFAPKTSQAYGVEFFLHGRHERFDWWAGYTYARTLDRIDGRDVPRRIDQPHAVQLDLNLRAGKHWNLNLAWRWHTGWPTTTLDGQIVVDEDGVLAVENVLGPLHGERLHPYHRLDLRASREWERRRGRLGLFVEIQNLYDRKNAAGFDVDLLLQESSDGTVRVIKLSEPWGGILPSFGITWDF